MGALPIETTSYPAALDTAAVQGGASFIVPTNINSVVAALVAIEGELGLGLKGTRATLAARLATNLDANGAVPSGAAFPTNPTPVGGQLFFRTDTKTFWIFDGALAQWQRLDSVATHAALGFLDADDHPHYLRTDGTREATADLNLAGNLGFKSGTGNRLTLDHGNLTPRVITFPDATDTLVVTSLPQTLFEKTLNTSILNTPTLVTPVAASIGPSATQQHTLPAVASDTVALLAAVQTLTNKTLTTAVQADVGPSVTQRHTLPAVASDTVALLAAAQTLTNKTLGATAMTGLLTLSGDPTAALHAATKQYADGKVDAVGAGGDSMAGPLQTTALGVGVAPGAAGSIIATGTLATRAGGLFNGTFTHAITAARTWTFPDLSDTVALLTAAQTLTNKTLSSPAIATPTFSGAYTLGGTPSVSALGPNGTNRHTLPAVTSDTFALLAATQTLSNKTLSSPTLSGTLTGGTLDPATALSIVNGGTGVATLPTGLLKGAGTGAITAVTAPAGAVVGTTDTQTLSAKTLTTPTIASFTNAQHDHAAAAGGGQIGVAAFKRTEVKAENASLVTASGAVDLVASINLGTVVAGDIIFVQAEVRGTITDTEHSTLSIQKSAGTATVQSLNDRTNIEQNQKGSSSSSFRIAALSGYYRVTVGGTLTLALFAGTDSVATWSISAGNGQLAGLVLRAS